MNTDKLNGKVVEYIDDMFDNSVYPAMVIIESGVGLTLVSTEDNEKLLYCLQGPLSNKEAFDADPSNHIKFEKYWESAVSQIKSGKFLNSVSIKLERELDGGYLSGENIPQDFCAFSM